MDHVHGKDIGLFFIIVYSFSGWPEVIKVMGRKATTIKEVLKTVFSGNGVQKTIVSNNVPEFCDENLCS